MPWTKRTSASLVKVIQAVEMTRWSGGRLACLVHKFWMSRLGCTLGGTRYERMLYDSLKIFFVVWLVYTFFTMRALLWCLLRQADEALFVLVFVGCPLMWLADVNKSAKNESRVNNRNEANDHIIEFEFESRYEIAFKWPDPPPGLWNTKWEH